MREGQIIGGRYELEARLGHGGLAEVWSARHTTIGRRVAVKVLKAMPSADAQRRFQIEARVLGQLDHSNCVTIFDFGTEDGQQYLVMELLDGRPLSKLRGQQLPIEDVRRIVGDITRALQHAHGLGIVHRDLKPENVFLVPTETGEQAKVLDFGLAKILNPSAEGRTATGEFGGTAPYMSPEQYRGLRDVGPPTDLYALGVIMFELIEGRLPFTGDSLLEMGQKHMFEAPPPIQRSDCPGQLAELVQQLLEKNPEDRLPTAEAVRQALEVSAVRSPRILVAVGFLLAVTIVAIVVAVATGEPPAAANRDDTQPDAGKPAVAHVSAPDRERPRPTSCLQARGEFAWEVYYSDEIVRLDLEGKPSRSQQFERAEMPGVDAEGWQPHADELEFRGKSLLNGPPGECKTPEANYLYFQAELTITEDAIDTATFYFPRLDDAVQLTIFNEKYPEGHANVDTYARGNRTLTPNFARHLVKGTNRLVLTLLDDCADRRAISAVLRVNGQRVERCGLPPAPSGCDTDPRVRGVVERETTVGLDTRRWTVFVPKDYEHGKRHPVLLLFHYDDVGASEFLSQTRLARFADDRNFVIIAPHDEPDPSAWDEPRDVRDVERILKRTSEELCIDTTRLMVLGHGSGAGIAEKLPCELDVRSIALMANREPPTCNKPVRTINISPTKSPRLPVKGGTMKECPNQPPVISLDAYEHDWQRQLNCTSRGEARSVENGECWAWTCDVDYVECHMPGGYVWPNGAEDNLLCDGVPTDFPIAREAMDFLMGP